MRRWNKVIFLGVTCLALAGCGKGRGDELSKDYQRNNALEGDVSAESDSVTGHLEYELVSDSGITFTVDADATGGGKLAESHCYGAKPVEVDEAYLKEHVYTIFDEGTLQQVKPYEVCSQQELANRQNQLLQRQQELQLQTDTENSSVHAIWENGIQSDLETEDWLADQRDESMVTEETGKAIYTYEIADGITTSLARVDGEIDEIPYVYTCAYYDSNAYPYSRMRYMRYDMYSYEAKITVRPKTEEDAVEGLDIREAEAKADEDHFNRTALVDAHRNTACELRAFYKRYTVWRLNCAACHIVANAVFHLVHSKDLSHNIRSTDHGRHVKLAHGSPKSRQISVSKLTANKILSCNTSCYLSHGKTVHISAYGRSKVSQHHAESLKLLLPYRLKRTVKTSCKLCKSLTGGAKSDSCNRHISTL